MAKPVKVNVEGFGTVFVDRPKKYDRATYADGVAEAVATTLGLILDRDRSSFHPVLGRGGYDWNHQTQSVDVSEAQTPGISYKEPRRIRFLVSYVSGHFQSLTRGIRSQFHKGDR